MPNIPEDEARVLKRKADIAFQTVEAAAVDPVKQPKVPETETKSDAKPHP